VTNITSEPSYFATDSSLTNSNKPVWGTCPTVSCTISGTLTSAVGSDSQTVSMSTAITSIEYTLTTTCSDTLSAAIAWTPSTPNGVSMSFSNNVATISGTPTGTATGTYNYTLTTSNTAGTASATFSGSLTVSSSTVSSSNSSSLNSCSSSISDDLNTLIVVSTLSKNSDGTGNLSLDDFKIQFVSRSGSTLSGVVKASSVSSITTCQNGTSYNLSGPFEWVDGPTQDPTWGGVLLIGNYYSINEISEKIEAAYLSGSNSNCESSNSCKELGIGRVDVYQKGYDSSGILVDFNRDYAALFKCSENPPQGVSYGDGFVRYSLDANGCGYLPSSCTISGTLTSAVGSNSQTVSMSTAITDIEYTLTTTCSDTLSTAIAWTPSTPNGVSMSFSNNVATISGTPTGTATGTYNYTLTASNTAGTASATFSGSLTVSSSTQSNTSTYNGPCTQVYLPDDKLEEFAVAIGADDVLDDYVCKERFAEKFNAMNVSGVSTIEGLRELILAKYPIGSQDRYTIQMTGSNAAMGNISSLTDGLNLYKFKCSSCGVTEIDLSSSSQLVELNLEDNPISSINLDSNTELQELFLSSTNITSLDLSPNNELRWIWIADGQSKLTSLTLPQGNAASTQANSSRVTSIKVQNQDLSYLDISNTMIQCSQGQGCPYGGLFAYGNPNLTCIKIRTSNVSYGTTNQFTLYKQSGLPITTSGNCGPNTAGTICLDASQNVTFSSTCPETFSIDVTATSSSDYTLSGTDRNGNVSGSDPNLTFKVGDTISFVVNASGHPFYLKTAAGTGTGDLISGIANNGAETETITWTPDTTGTFYYQCSLHGGMVGTITIE
jgi:plastocyanin